jgi:predicted ester cyclase
MNSEDFSSVCEKFLNSAGNNDEAVLECLVSKEATIHAPALAFKDTKTLWDYHQGMKTFTKSLPDFDLKYKKSFTKDGDVYIYEVGTASYSGEELFGVKPNGKRMNWIAFWIFNMKDGKIESATKFWDQQSTFIQVDWEFPSK